MIDPRHRLRTFGSGLFPSTLFSALFSALITCCVPCNCSADAQEIAHAEQAAKLSANDRDQIAQLIDQLASNKRSERDKAAKVLVDWAESHPDQIDALLSELPESNAQMPPALRFGLRAARARIEAVRGKAASRASLLTLDLKSTPLSEVLALVEQQTGNRLKDNREQFGEDRAATPLTLTAKGEPFWQVIDRILDAANLDTYPYGAAGELALVTRPQGGPQRSGKACYAGPFRIVPIRFIGTRGLNDPSESDLELHLEIEWEPRLRPIVITQHAHEFSGVDSLDAPLQANLMGEQLSVEVTGGVQATELVLRFQSPKRLADSIRSLSGTLQTMLPGTNARFEFEQLGNFERPQPAANQAGVQKQGGASLMLRRFFKNNAIWELRMELQLAEAGDALASHRGWIFDNPSYLVTPDGRRIEHGGFETTLQTESTIGLAYLFDLEFDAEGKPIEGPPIDPAELKWVYETPTEILSTPIEYQFKDLPLP